MPRHILSSCEEPEIGGGIRQAGGRGSVVGKALNAGAVGLEKRYHSSSFLW